MIRFLIICVKIEKSIENMDKPIEGINRFS